MQTQQKLDLVNAALAESLPAPSDRRALAFLIGTNLLTIALALWQGWPVALLMWIYWLQSVVIGVFSAARILGLQRFSTEGFKSNGQSMDPTPATKRSTAIFFCFHYGFFHVGYAVFLLTAPMPAGEWPWVLLAGAVFLINHWQSFLRFREADRQGEPNIGTLMFLPYLRIVPMHLTIIFGLGFVMMASGGSGTGNSIVILMFGALKTVADALMHVAEHAILAKSGKPKATPATA